MIRFSSPHAAFAAVRDAARAGKGQVFMPGAGLEPLAWADAAEAEPDLLDGLSLHALLVPGYNRTDWTALHPNAGMRIFLPSPDFAGGLKAARTALHPLHYTAAYGALAASRFDAAVFHMTPPDQKGLCGLSLAADTTAAVWGRAGFRLGLINHALPRIEGAPRVALADLDGILEIDRAPPAFAAAPAAGADHPIVRQVAALVGDGDTIQIGIGRLPSAILAALTDRRNLRLHGGLVGDGALALSDAGALAAGPGAITAGIVLGSTRLAHALGPDERLRLLPVPHTHGPVALAAVPRLTAINAALEVDLFGQINCEYAGSRLLSGVGGAVDFIRGARLSEGGRAIVMVEAEGRDGISRIVPRLTAPSVSIARADAPIVVTEHGSADLGLLDVEARARAVISLAAPAHREALSLHWKTMQA